VSDSDADWADGGDAGGAPVLDGAALDGPASDMGGACGGGPPDGAPVWAKAGAENAQKSAAKCSLFINHTPWFTTRLTQLRGGANCVHLL
jgi:hypothetical protein